MSGPVWVTRRSASSRPRRLSPSGTPAVGVPARERLPHRPQHGVGHVVRRQRHRDSGVEKAPNRNRAFADLLQVEAIACHVHEVRRHRGNDPELLHACDLVVGRLDDVNHHPAAIADRHHRVDCLVGLQHPLDLVADEAAQPNAQPCRVDADLHEAVVVERMVEVSGPRFVGIVLADDCGGLLVGDVDADPLEPEHVVAASAMAEAAWPTPRPPGRGGDRRPTRRARSAGGASAP